MIFIPGPLIALATFPGVVMHEIAHRFMCDLLQTPVFDVHYFSIGSTRAGYVLHQKTNNLIHSLLISCAPLFINSFFCMLFTLPFFSYWVITGQMPSNPPTIFLAWLGISMGANAFPSDQDVHHVLSQAQEQKRSLTIRFFCYLIKLLNFCSVAWVDFIYAVGISFIIPKLIFSSNLYP